MLEEGWKNTIDDSVSNPAWDDYDTIIQTEITDYNSRFGCAADWKLFKAQIWTESGAKSPAWKTRPAQIGNPGDDGYGVMKSGAENSDIVMSSALKAAIKTTSINNPQFNIKLGIAYVITKIATFGTQISNPTILEYSVKSGDSVDRIALTVGSTRQNIIDLNHMTDPSRIGIGQKLKYQKASIQVTGCPAITPELLQSRYNGNRDSAYAEKIKYCLQVMSGIKR